MTMGLDWIIQNPKSKIQNASSAGVIGAIAAALVMGGFSLLSDPDIRFCRRALAQLVNMNLSVGRSIDWAHLQALEVNVGATYAALPSRQEQADYEQAFIRNFAGGFRKNGGRLDGFTRWRVASDGTVSADYPAKQKTLVFHLSGGKGRQLEGLGWSAQMEKNQ